MNLSLHLALKIFYYNLENLNLRAGRINFVAVLSASRTQHSEQYTHRTYDMLPHHHITYNDVDFYRILTYI